MFPNLRAEMARRGYRVKDMAKKMGINPKTLSLKLSGRSDFTLSEMVFLKRSYFPDLSLDYLFEEKDTA